MTIGCIDGSMGVWLGKYIAWNGSSPGKSHLLTELEEDIFWLLKSLTRCGNRRLGYCGWAWKPSTYDLKFKKKTKQTATANRY